MGQVFLFSLTAALNPTLVAAASVMLLLPRPARLMLGYLCGAMMTSVTLGIVIVLAFNSSGTTTTTQHTLSPAADLALGGIALVIAFVLHRDREGRRRAARRERKKDKGPPRWQQVLSKGSPRATFAIGALLTLPGASYIASLHALHELHYSTAVDVLVVIGINVVMLVLLEGPLVSFAVAPDWTPRAIDRAKAALGRNWRPFAVKALVVIGAALIIKGALGLILQ